MNTSSPCLCGCNQLVPQPPTGRAKKYLDDSHRITHFRRNKAELKTIQAKSSPTPPPVKPTQTPDSNPLTVNGVDYSDPYKVMPASLACYMPVQSHESLHQKLAFEHQLFHGKPASDDSSCAF